MRNEAVQTRSGDLRLASEPHKHGSDRTADPRALRRAFFTQSRNEADSRGFGVTFARPLAFTWPVGVACLAVSLWIFAAELPVVRAARRAQRALPREKRDHSLRILVGGQQVAMTVALILAFTTPSLTMRPATLVYWLGVALLVASGVLRRHCFRMLGEDFRGAVTVRSGQPVVDRGAYHYVRHPSYLAALMMHAGIGLALTNWASLIALVATSTPLFVYRIGVEEGALLRGLGQPYADYMARTHRLLPGVW